MTLFAVTVADGPAPSAGPGPPHPAPSGGPYGVAEVERRAAKQRRLLVELSGRETVNRLARALALRDACSGGHVARMAAVAAHLAERVGLGRTRTTLLRVAAPTHDIGKIAIPDQILNKPGPLTYAERAEMERHTTIGHALLDGSESRLLQLAAAIALTHHERFDGSGYPHGLRGGEIPIEGRIAAVADVFDALLSDRPYRPARSPEETRRTFASERGRGFDPVVVDALLDDFGAALARRSSSR
jgi:two-component system, response regulator RpfG